MICSSSPPLGAKWNVCISRDLSTGLPYQIGTSITFKGFNVKRKPTNQPTGARPQSCSTHLQSGTLDKCMSLDVPSQKVDTIAIKTRSVIYLSSPFENDECVLVKRRGNFPVESYHQIWQMIRLWERKLLCTLKGLFHLLKAWHLPAILSGIKPDLHLWKNRAYTMYGCTLNESLIEVM